MKKIKSLFMVLGITIFILAGCGEVEYQDEYFVEQENSTEIEENSSVEEVVLAEETTKEESKESLPTYTYNDMAVTKYAKSSVNVRDLPSTKGNKLGALLQNDSVSVTGQCAETNWYRIDYKGTVGYVSNNYLVDEKIVTEVASETVTSSSENSADVGNTSSDDKGNGVSVTVPDHAETGGNLVWVPTKGGKKYHSKSSCSGMEEPMQVSLETAIANGYTACKRCH